MGDAVFFAVFVSGVLVDYIKSTQYLAINMLEQRPGTVV